MNYIHLLFFVDPFLNFAPGSWELEIYRNLRGLPLRTPGRCHGAERAVPGGLDRWKTHPVIPSD